jgi:hypothetical protein
MSSRLKNLGDSYRSNGKIRELVRCAGQLEPRRQIKAKAASLISPLLIPYRLQREMEQILVRDYDVTNMPSADKRAVFALKNIAFRVGRIEQRLADLLAALKRQPKIKC